MGFVDKFQEMVEMVKKRATNSVDPEVFNHPVAKDTDWYPLAGGGTNFQTHRLDSSNPDLLVFKATRGVYWFAGVFCFFGLLGLITPLSIFFAGGMQEWALFGFGTLFGGIFTGAGLLLLYFMTKPRVFDTFYGVYYKGRKKPQESMTMGASRDRKQGPVSLHEVEAVQVIRERVRGKNSSYYSFEINLVLADASRINVIDHGKHSAVIEDAETLATALGVPLWDGS